MTFPNFLTNIGIWCVTTTLTFTSTMAHYILPQLKATISTFNNNYKTEPSIWKQHIYCVSQRIYITKAEILHVVKELQGSARIFRTGRGYYFYNKIECKTYGPIVAVAFIVSLLGSTLLFKLWTKYYHAHTITTPSLPKEQQPFLLSTTSNLQQKCAIEDKSHATQALPIPVHSTGSVQ